MKKIVCEKCGSDEILITEQLNPNDDTAIRRYFADAYAMDGGLCFCDSCMEQQRFHVVDIPDVTPANPWRCERCGSSDVQQQAWVRPDTGEVVSFNDCDRGDYWCEPCGEHPRLVRESELMATIEKWFAGDLRPNDDEVISGLNRNDFTTDEAFETACKEKWDARDTESKIGIWRELTRNLKLILKYR